MHTRHLDPTEHSDAVDSVWFMFCLCHESWIARNPQSSKTKLLPLSQASQQFCVCEVSGRCSEPPSLFYSNSFLRKQLLSPGKAWTVVMGTSIALSPLEAELPAVSQNEEVSLFPGCRCYSSGRQHRLQQEAPNTSLHRPGIFHCLLLCALPTAPLSRTRAYCQHSLVLRHFLPLMKPWNYTASDSKAYSHSPGTTICPAPCPPNQT